MQREVQLELTINDVLWLAEIDRAMQAPPLQSVVSVEQYCAAVDANDYVTRQNYRLRRQRKKALRVARRIQAARRIGGVVILILSALVVMLAYALAGKVGR